jgi:LmbE family N-acetylglucosaminyl deacetylase
MEWIFISPHFDDVAYSCGGLVWELCQAGHPVTIWTIFSGSQLTQPMPATAQLIHSEWGVGAEILRQRPEEDKRSCAILGAAWRHSNWLDCIYRYRASGAPLIEIKPDLWTAVPEAELIAELAAAVRQAAAPGIQLVCPMALGSHVDHRLVRTAVEAAGRPLLYYADYPYILTAEAVLAEMETGAWRRIPAVISDPGLAAWQEASLAHISQMSTFWSSERELEVTLRNFWSGGGGRLWRR